MSKFEKKTRTFLAKRKRLTILVSLVLILAMSSPLIVEACKTHDKDDYVLRLYGQDVDSNGKIRLIAQLKIIITRWFHHWHCHSNVVPNARIYFYSCNWKGYGYGPTLGSVLTNRSGIATLLLNLNDIHPTKDNNHDNITDYWFIAKFWCNKREFHSQPPCESGNK